MTDDRKDRTKKRDEGDTSMTDSDVDDTAFGDDLGTNYGDDSLED